MTKELAPKLYVAEDSRTPGVERLIQATTKAGAQNAAASTISVRLASTLDVARLVGAGTKIENETSPQADPTLPLSGTEPLV